MHKRIVEGNVKMEGGERERGEGEEDKIPGLLGREKGEGRRCERDGGNGEVGEG